MQNLSGKTEANRGGPLSAAYSQSDARSILEQCKAIMKEVEKMKFPVFAFSPFIPENAYYKGEFVNVMCNCDKDEEGYLFNARYQDMILNYCKEQGVRVRVG